MSSRRCRSEAWLLAVASLFVAPAVAAQSEGLREASQLAAHHDHRGAVRVLREARRTAPDPRIDLNLALSLSRLGQLREAHQLLSQLIRSNANPLVVDAARAHLDRLEARVPRLLIHVEAPDETRLTVDGSTVPREAGPVSIIVDPGEHRVELFEGDRSAAGETVVATRGELTTVHLRAPTALTTRPAPTVVPVPARRRLRADSPAPEDIPDRSDVAAANLEASLMVRSPAAPRDGTATPGDGAPDHTWLHWTIGGAAVGAVLTTVLIAAAVAAAPSATSSDADPIRLGPSR